MSGTTQSTTVCCMISAMHCFVLTSSAVLLPPARRARRQYEHGAPQPPQPPQLRRMRCPATSPRDPRDKPRDPRARWRSTHAHEITSNETTVHCTRTATAPATTLMYLFAECDVWCMIAQCARHACINTRADSGRSFRASAGPACENSCAAFGNFLTLSRPVCWTHSRLSLRRDKRCCKQAGMPEQFQYDGIMMREELNFYARGTQFWQSRAMA